jgi:uncharacterized protein (TIGR03435 family)
MRVAAFCTVALFATAPATVADGQAFDAASVKLFNRETPQPYTITGGPGTSDPSRFRAPRIAMANLLAKAFDVSTDQITGPAWLRDVTSNDYTITATMPPDTTKEQFQKMLQNLLAERFHLVFHRETRSFPGYALVVDKGGPKFKEVESTVSASAPPTTRTMVIFGPGSEDFPALPPGPLTITRVISGGERTKYQERTMAEFVTNLGFTIGKSEGKSVLDGYIQPRVVDRTGLSARYTFVLEYYSATSETLASQFPSRPDAGNGPPPAGNEPGSGFPNIHVAIQKQLGLRLDKIANVPLDMIVVDSVDKVPATD